MSARMRMERYVETVAVVVQILHQMSGVFELVFQRLPNSHIGLAIRAVWGKWCGLSIWSGLCCYSRYDARTQMQLRGVWFLTETLPSISLGRIAASARTVSLDNRDFAQRIFTGVSKQQ